MVSTRSECEPDVGCNRLGLLRGDRCRGVTAMNLTSMQQMMVADGLPASCIISQAERDAAWAKNPPRAMPAQTSKANMSVQDQLVYWSHHIDQIKAKGRVQGVDVSKELATAERELAKLGGGDSVPMPAMAAPKANPTSPPVARVRPQNDAAAMGHTPRVRAEPSAMAGASVVKGIDNGGLVTADDLGKEFAIPAKVVRRLLRTHKPVPKPAWGWSFDETTVEAVRNFLRTKTNTGSSAKSGQVPDKSSRDETTASAGSKPALPATKAIAVSRERSHAPAKEAKPSKPARTSRKPVRSKKAKGKGRR